MNTDSCNTEPCLKKACFSINPFQRVVVTNRFTGGTAVTWDLAPGFADAGPYIFSLLVGQNPDKSANTWTRVGLPATDAYVLYDDTQRMFGTSLTWWWCVELTTPVATYRSDPVTYEYTWNFRDWRLAAEIVRKERINFFQTGTKGYLLKRRTGGERCPRCSDYQTLEATSHNCTVCFGTGILGGYYPPISCVWVVFTSPTTIEQQQTLDQGTTGIVVNQVRVVPEPEWNKEDVWIDAQTDQRWVVRKVTSSDLRGRPVVLPEVTIVLLAPNHVIYTIPVSNG